MQQEFANDFVDPKARPWVTTESFGYLFNEVGDAVSRGYAEYVNFAENVACNGMYGGRCVPIEGAEVSSFSPLDLLSGGISGLLRAPGKWLFGWGADELTPIVGNKLSYFLGQVTSSAHYIERSTMMFSQLTKICLWNTPATRSYLMQNQTNVFNDASSIVRTLPSGYVVRESLLAEPGGFLKWETVWEGTKLLGGLLKGAAFEGRSSERSTMGFKIGARALPGKQSIACPRGLGPGGNPRVLFC